jgi:DNA-binding transcriptional LysR family regulator
MGFARGELPESYWPLVGGGKVRVEGVLFSNEIRLLCDAAIRGLGIAFLPLMLARVHVENGALVQVLPGVVEAESRVALVYPERELVPPQVRAFIDELTRAVPRVFEAEQGTMSSNRQSAQPSSKKKAVRRRKRSR